MSAEWDEPRTELLKRLWVAGETARTIAERLGGGVTRNAVIGKAHRLGLTGKQGSLRAALKRRPAPASTTSNKQPQRGAKLRGQPLTGRSLAPAPSTGIRGPDRDRLAAESCPSVLYLAAVVTSLSLNTTQGKQELDLLQRHGLTGEPAIDSTEPSPQPGLNGGVNVASSAMVLGLAHRTHSGFVELNLRTTWLTKSYGQG